ncbi:S-adenosylmethionine:tRNA ribosyltransferase-isomerase [Parabacteroides bouchesdurhonensis]|uniref:S-adenosylmethionine:tRNA ribosyltransferase-isomerase n=1 Tax=Parabacteroides bouchesdurhonensis TaxID=1936995 RepID=UPI000E497C47|nr:S-adenosylmethionine:tRNA ribosyltransferase-isomerase [Parabacteroides bouchesdurhonensis]RHJ93442.1 S-adenosylmethionine:tRNA ribosyltransferase-isomerase [Bacteroides sp. AM07-16]
MTTKTQQIRIEDYNYSLPDERIAKFPLAKRDESKLLLYRNGEVSESIFKHITDYLPQGSLMVFNNTRVIQARLLFQKETGAKIEIFCLEPVEPHDYALVFQQTERCSWTCLVGNLKKWKEGILSKTVIINETSIRLNAEKKHTCGDSHLIEFTWDNPSYTFADLLDATGVLPIPPYLHRETEKSDLQTYQTVYSKIKGSVAAPTAGLHFTPEVLADIDAHGIGREEVTLHVGAGTFKPVKSDTIEGHEMHTEFISVHRNSIEKIKNNLGKIIAVGTTSVRTIESLYYMGVTLANNPEATSDELIVKQWMPYEMDNNRLLPEEALQNILDYLDKHQANKLVTATQIIIAPGYEFKLVKGIVTNFHQPKSTLLLLISAFVKGNWKLIYDYALKHDFRFLSYGDSSLLFP